MVTKNKKQNDFSSVLEEMEEFFLNTFCRVRELVCIGGGDPVAGRLGGQPGMKTLLM